MCFRIFMLLVPGLLALAVRADEKLPILRAGSETYSNVTVTTVSATDVYFTYAGGMGNVKIKNLSPDLRQHFDFDPKKAAEVEALQATNKLKYHEQLLHQPAVSPPDMTRDAATPAAAQPPVWLANLSRILQEAQSENKLVLLAFIGSDWDKWSIKFNQEVLASKKFNDYANQKLIIVKADFPHQIPQSMELKQANAALLNQFKIPGFPTCVLLGAGGKELGVQAGYLPGGPDAFITELEVFSHQ